MIFDNLKNLSFYSNLDKNLREGLEWLTKNGSKIRKVGRYEIKDDKIFAIVSNYETKRKDKGSWEAHKKYIDIHYLVEGQEKVGFANVGQLKIQKEYDSIDDYMLLSGNGNFLTLKENYFAVFFPQDAHMPGLDDERKMKIRKIVVKVKVK